MDMMQRFGVSELVPSQIQQPSDVSTAGSLGVGRLGLATPTGTNRSSAPDLILSSESTRRPNNQDIMHPSTRTGNETLEMEIDDSEDDR